MKSGLTQLVNLPSWEWPRSARVTILDVLRGQDAALRTTAARLAGDLLVMNDEVAAALLTIVQNDFEPEELRAAAAIAFGAVLESVDIKEPGDPLDPPEISQELFNRIQTALLRLHGGERAPKQLRRRALEASVRASRDWHQEAVRAAFASGDEEWNLTAIFCARWIRGFDAEILRMLNSSSEDIRREAVHAAGNWELKQAWPTIAGLLKAPATEKFTRIAAIEASISIRPEEAAKALENLTGSEDEDIAEAAEDALAMLGFGTE